MLTPLLSGSVLYECTGWIEWLSQYTISLDNVQTTADANGTSLHDVGGEFLQMHGEHGLWPDLPGKRSASSTPSTIYITLSLQRNMW